jgi:5-methylcytosine-specific restriction endonuclease McrA
MPTENRSNKHLPASKRVAKRSNDSRIKDAKGNVASVVLSAIKTNTLRPSRRSLTSQVRSGYIKRMVHEVDPNYGNCLVTNAFNDDQQGRIEMAHIIPRATKVKRVCVVPANHYL